MKIIAERSYFVFQLDFASRVPIYEQLYRNVVKLASVGAIKPGDKLPPVRTIATQLGVNPNTAAKAYHILENDGYIYTTVGRGSFLTDKLSKNSAEKIMAIEEFKKSVLSAHTFGAEEKELVEYIHKIFKGGENLD